MIKQSLRREDRIKQVIMNLEHTLRNILECGPRKIILLFLVFIQFDPVPQLSE